MAREKSQGRTKACANCKRRKIKCDEKLPSCSPCVRFKRECGGAVGGMIFVNATGSQQKPKGKPRHHGAPPRSKALFDAGGSSSSSSSSSSLVTTRAGSSSSLEADFERLAIGRYARDLSTAAVLPSSGEISARAVFTQALIARWIEVCSVGGMSWITVIPGMEPGRRFARVEAGFVAASLAHYGKVAGDAAATRAARRLYGRELARQRRRMGVLERREERAGLEDVVAAMALMFCELVDPSGPTGYFGHVVCAEQVLVLMGPERCREEDVSTIFYIVRSEMGYASLRRRKPSVFAQTQWMTKPFAGKRRTIFDRLGDAYVLLPAIIARFDELAATTDYDTARATLITDSEILLSEIDAVTASVAPDLERDLQVHKLTSSTIAQSEVFREHTNNFMAIAILIPRTFILSTLTRLLPESSYFEAQLRHDCAVLMQETEHILNLDMITSTSGVIIALFAVVLLTPDGDMRRRAREMMVGQPNTGGIEDYVRDMIIATLPFGEMPAHLWFLDGLEKGEVVLDEGEVKGEGGV